VIGKPNHEETSENERLLHKNSGRIVLDGRVDKEIGGQRINKGREGNGRVRGGKRPPWRVICAVGSLEGGKRTESG